MYDKIAFRVVFQVSEAVRFLLSRGLRFRDLGLLGHD